MKIAVINFSGNVGKSTVSKHLLAPRLPSAEYIAVESINADDNDIDMIRGKHFGHLQERMLTLNSAIVDIGASNVEDFIKLMQVYRGSHEDFDYYVIPAVKESKQIKDTIATIQALTDMKVPAHKIRVVFNKLETDDLLEDVFYPLLAFYEDKKAFCLNKNAVLHYSEIYQKIRSLQLSIDDLLTDQTDYKTIAKYSDDYEEKMHAIMMVTLKRLAISAKENLDEVYKAVIN